MSRSLNVSLFGIFFHVEVEPVVEFFHFDRWIEQDGSQHFYGFGRYWFFVMETRGSPQTVDNLNNPFG